MLAAGSGQGKSHLIRRVAELAFEEVQIFIIDPEGEYNTLREKFPFGLIGPGGETPADIKTAAIAARHLIEKRVSTIVDVSELQSPRNEEYVRVFLKTAMEVGRKYWHPILFIIDEAAIYAPSNAKLVDTPYAAIFDMIRRGRKRGFSLILATQRLVSLNNNVTNTRNLVIGGSGKPVDQDRAAEVLGNRKQDSHIFQDLSAGEFFAQGPAFGMKGNVLFTSGDVQTTHEHDIAYDVPPVPKNAEKVMAFLAALPAAAKEEVDQLAQLQGKNSELTRQVGQLTADLKRAEQQQKIQTKEVRIEVPVVDKALLGDLVALERAARLKIEAAAEVPAQIAALAERVKALAAKAKPLTVAAATPVRISNGISTSKPYASPGLVKADTDSSLAPGELKTLIACAQYPNGVQRDQLTSLTGYTRSSRNTFISKLSQRGAVAVQGQVIKITDEGLGLLPPDFEPLPTGLALQEYWAQRLPPGEAKTLRVLIANYPNEIQREAIDEQIGATRSSRNTYISKLKARELVVVGHSGAVKASPNLFD